MTWLTRLAGLRLLAWLTRLALLHVGRELRTHAGGIERGAHGLAGLGYRLDGLVHIGVVIV